MNRNVDTENSNLIQSLTLHENKNQIHGNSPKFTPSTLKLQLK
jgi:hypothetical protein